MKSIYVLPLLVVTVLTQCKSLTAVATGEYYTLDSLADNSKNVSLTVQSNGLVTVGPSSRNEPRQRFIGRLTSGGTNIFNLFSEVQPWNWIDYIVESSKTVNIKDKHPQVLDSAIKDGVHTVFSGDYKGEGTNSHKWYVVPTGQDGEIGAIVNVASKFCLTNNGAGSSATLGICDVHNPNQVWKVTLQAEGRCF